MLNNHASELKNSVDLRQLVGYFWGQPLRRTPKYDVFTARWRDDGRHASFTVYDTYFIDYGGAGDKGDVFTFLERELNIDFKAAVDWLVEYLGGTASPHPKSLSLMERDLSRRTALPLRPEGRGDEGKVAPPPAAWQQAAAKALRRAQQFLWSHHPAAIIVRAYLHTVRGLTDETIRSAGYGYNPTWQKVPIQGEKSVYLAPGIIEPWECDGVLWALRVRCRVGNLAEALNMPSERGRDGEELPKYLNLAGSKQSGALYNADSIRPDKPVLLVEGGFDAQLAQQILGNAVAVVTFGSANNTPTPQLLEQIQQAKRIFLLLDADAAGQGAQHKLIAALGDEAVALALPQGKDVTDYVVEHGGDLAALLVKPQGWWRDGVPDAVRSALLTYFRPVTAPVIEMLNTAAVRGLFDPDRFTIEDALHANAALAFNLSESSVRRVIRELNGHLFSKLETNKHRKDIVSNSGNSDPRVQFFRFVGLKGVKTALLAWAVPRLIEKHYRVQRDAQGVIMGGVIADPTPAMFVALGFHAEMAAELAYMLTELAQRVLDEQGEISAKARKYLQRDYQQLVESLNEAASTPLPDGWPVGTPAEYRAAFLRATNDPEKRRSRREISDQLGIANGSIKALIAQAGLEKAVPDGEFVTKPLQSPDFLEFQVQRVAREVKGYPRALVVNHADGRSQELFYTGAEMQPEIAAFVAQGAAVAVRLQVANRYVEATQTPPVAAIQSAPVKKPPPDAPRPQPQTPPRRAFYGPGHDPLWVTEQFQWLLLRLDLLAYHGARLLDKRTGELVDTLAGDDLAGIFARARPLSADSPNTLK